MPFNRRFFAASLLVAAAVLPFNASSQDYPTRPITIICAFPAGSSTDGVARMVAESLRRTLKQNVLVENKPGQDGAIGGRAAAHAEPDGYTLLLGGNSTHSAPMSLYKSLAYAPESDFVSLGGITKIPLILTVRPDFPGNDLAAFIKVASDPSRKLSFGSGATSTRAAGELLKAAAGFDAVHVPYRGIPTAVTDLLGGRIDVVISDPTTALSIIEDGKLKALAVTSSTRMKRLPEVKTIAEQGIPGFEVVPWLAMFAPVKTPAPIVAKLQAAVETAQKDPDVQAYLLRLSMEPFPLTPAQLSSYLTDDIKRWADFVTMAKIDKN